MSTGAAAVAWASLNGTIELLALSSAGAYLAHRGVLDGKAVLTLSQTMVQLLIPSLIYYSMLEGLHAARQNMSMTSLAELIFPPLWAFFVLSVGLLVAVPSSWLLARGKAEPVRRAIIVCIMIGNGRGLPLLILSALCDNFAPFRSDPRCVPRAAEIVSLFCVIWNFVLWVPVFAYMVSAPDVESDTSVEDGLIQPRPSVTVKRPGLFSPPTMAAIVAIATFLIPTMTEALLAPGGLFSPIFGAIRLMGNMVVPTSALIVGAKIYSSQMKDKSDTALGGMFVPPRKKFGFWAHAGILSLRMIIIPFIGRVMYRALNLWQIPGKLLGVFSLVELAVPTANNTVMIVVIMSQFLPNLGPQLEEDVATTILIQYATLPFLLTMNTAFALNIVFNEKH